MENELGLTALFNQYLAGPGNALRHLIGLSATERPWDNSVVMELLVAAFLVVTVAILRSSLSVDKPGKLQHIFEMLHEFFTTTVHEVGIHHGEKYIPFIGTLFIFILTMNLIGIVPAFESPTMSPWVPAGLAIVTFIYFNAMGFAAQGIKYFAHFAGPVRFPHPLANVAIILFMLPIETTDPEVRPGIERAAAGARASGTPFISFFMPEEMLTLAREAGFKQVQHVSAAALADRYFAGRTDGLRPPNNSEELLLAST